MSHGGQRVPFEGLGGIVAYDDSGICFPAASLFAVWWIKREAQTSDNMVAGDGESGMGLGATRGINLTRI